MARKAAPSPSRVPTRDDVLDYLRNREEPAGVSELARAFNVKGKERTALRLILRELEDEDLIDAPARRKYASRGRIGAVGSLSGQIAKVLGCRVVGSAGTDEKIAHITNDLGFDAAFNYKTTEDYNAKVAELCPAGVDCYFDNVGGTMLDAAMINMNQGARFAICGHISMYNATKPEMAPRMTGLLIERTVEPGMRGNQHDRRATAR